MKFDEIAVICSSQFILGFPRKLIGRLNARSICCCVRANGAWVRTCSREINLLLYDVNSAPLAGAQSILAALCSHKITMVLAAEVC